MKNANCRTWTRILALACLLAAPTTVMADILYDNSSERASEERFGQSGYEFGEEIVLVGNGTYTITDFTYEYFGYGADFGANNVEVQLRLYRNDGLNGIPGSILFSSGFYPIPATGSSGANIQYSGLNVAVPRSFTWTVEFRNLSPAAAVGLQSGGLDLYNIPTVGFTYDDFWERSGLGGTWDLRKPTPGNPPINFGCRVVGFYAGPPAIVTQPLSQNVRPGATVTLTASAIGTTALSYQWRKDGLPIAGATSDTLTLANVGLSDAGAYTLVVANAQGSVTSAAAFLSVNFPLLYDNSTTRALYRLPYVGFEFGEEIVLAGNGTSYRVTNFLYEYYGEGPDFPANAQVALRFYANDGPLGVPGTLLFDSGYYPIPATSEAGSVINYAGLDVVVPRNFTWTVNFSGVSPLSTAALDIYGMPTIGHTYDDYWERSGTGSSWELFAPTNGAPPLNFGCQVAGIYTGAPYFTVQPQSLTGFLGQNISLSAYALGTAPLTYQWYKNGNPIPGATTLSLPFPSLTAGDAGTYSVVAVNGQGTATSQSAVLTVQANTPPTVSIASPANGATFTSGTEITVIASAADPDGAYGGIASVAFLIDGIRLTSVSNAPYTFTWTNSTLGTHTLTAEATDNVGATTVSSPVSITVTFDPSGTNTLVNQGSQWKYRDSGIDPGATWPTTGYDDSAWTAGLAQFGYGEGDEASVVGFGPDVNNRHITTWFRHTWQVTDPNAFAALQFKLLRDDGAVVYLNGVEVARQNMPAGPVTASTLASSDVSGADETTFFSTVVGKQGIVAGANLLAVELHKASASSPDLSFDLQLLALGAQAPLIIGCTDLTANTAAGLCTATVTFPTPTVYDNEDTLIATCTPASGSAFPKGVTTVTCSATDTDSNTGSCSFTVTVSDTQAPAANCPANLTVSTSTGTCASNVTYTATATDNCPGSTIACSPASGSSFSLGTTTVNCTATDASGNTATCSFTVTVNDTQNPTLTCPANITSPAAPGACSATVTYTAATVTDNCSSGLTANCSPASGGTFNKGTTTVTCSALDTAGNLGICTFTVTVTDDQNPTITCPANQTLSANSGSCSATATWSTPATTDNCPGSTVACSPTSGSSFNLGNTTVTCTATDASANTATCSFTVTVVDATAPVLTCPSNKSVPTSPGLCSAVVTYSTCTVVDNCSPGLTATCSPASGSTFNKGVTTVVCSATDTAGNVGTCSFTVTVNDNQNPVLTCPASFTTITDPGSCFKTVTYATATVTDNCSPAPAASCSPASGFSFPKGTTTVICSATDASGNQGTCSFTITVQDAQPPVITCPGNITVNTSGNSCASNVTYTATISDNCSSATVTCSPPSGFPFPGGSTTVTCTGSDSSANSATPCSFLVVVVDNQPPTITCPANITIATVPGYVTNVTWTVTVTDNCPTTHLACTPPSGSPFANGTTTTVNCTVSDDGGGSQSCSFTVTVTDLGPPCVTEVLYGFNELLGTTATDASGSGNTGTLINGPIRTAGPVTEALQFDGVNDRVVCNNTTGMDITGNITLGCWLRPVNTSDSRYLVVKGADAGANWSYRLAVVKGKVQYSWVSPAGTINTFATSRNVLSAGKWIHFAVSHQPGTSPTFYINGAVEPSGLAGGSATALRRTSSLAFTVGSSSDGVGPFNGAIDEVFVASSLLNNAQLWSLTNGISPCARPALTITTVSPLANAAVGSSYSLVFSATGGSQPYTWSLASGSLPAGLSLDSSGLLAGTPTLNGTFSFRVRVTDGVAGTAEKDFSLFVSTPPPPVITSADPLPSGMLGKPYGISLSANGAGPFTWSVLLGSLPSGLTLAPSTGIISGTPTAAVTNTFTIKVTDSWGISATKVFTLGIESAPNYAVYYRFEETTGTTAFDTSGNNNTGTLVNGPTRISSPTGNAIRFDGINDRVTANTSASLNHTGALTLAAWVFPETVADLRTIMIKGDGKATTSFTWALRQSGAKLQYRWITGSKTENRYETTGGILAVGRWTHVALVHTPGSTTPPRFYSNGVAVAGTLAAGSYLNRFGTISSPFAVGSGANGNQPYYGAIDEVMFVRSALSSNGVANLMQMAMPMVILPAAVADSLAPIQLSIEQGPGAFLLRWNTQPGRSYRVQHRVPQVGETQWLNLSDWLVADREIMTYQDAAEDRFFRWYRVVTGE